MEYKLSALCQSPVTDQISPSMAIANTIELAKYCDELNYHRFWCAEHHNTRSFASASPEILISSIAAQTKNIKVGSGGVMMSHYAPFKIAEQFNLLQAIYPNRIDLGIGRASGADGRAAEALTENCISNKSAFDKYDSLLSYLGRGDKSKKEFPTVNASPVIENACPVWILGTSLDSAIYAAQRGLPYCFARFINGEEMLDAIKMYCTMFRPSQYLDSPYLMMGIFALVAESDEKAEYLAKSSESWIVRSFIRRQDPVFMSSDDALMEKYNLNEQFLIDIRKSWSFVGSAKKVKTQLDEFAKQYAINEFMIVTLTHNHQDRLISYKLLMDQYK